MPDYKTIREYLRRFPHRDEDMSKYGVCREWLKEVICAESGSCRCAEPHRYILTDEGTAQ